MTPVMLYSVELAVRHLELLRKSTFFKILLDRRSGFTEIVSDHPACHWLLTVTTQQRHLLIKSDKQLNNFTSQCICDFSAILTQIIMF